LRAGRAEQAQAALLRTAVGALVRQDDAAVVRLGTERGDQAGTRAGDAVGAGVVLRQEPVARLTVAREYAVLPPVDEVAAGLLLIVGQGQVDDVVRAPGEVALALLRRDDVVGRCHESLERARV